MGNQPLRFGSEEWMGKRFGNLTVIEPVHVLLKSGRMQWFWLMRCDCGKELFLKPVKVIKGLVRSCGCTEKEEDQGNKQPDERCLKLHDIWLEMRAKCRPDRTKAASDRDTPCGIKVCDEWDSFESFADWARNNGYQDGYTIERISARGDYCPENCTWIPEVKPVRRRKILWAEFRGEIMSLAEACKRTHMPYEEALDRIASEKWSVEKALTCPRTAFPKGKLIIKV